MDQHAKPDSTTPLQSMMSKALRAMMVECVIFCNCASFFLGLLQHTSKTLPVFSELTMKLETQAIKVALAYMYMEMNKGEHKCRITLSRICFVQPQNDATGPTC